MFLSFFTRIISGENDPKLNSDLVKLKFVIFPFLIFVFSPLNNSSIG